MPFSWVLWLTVLASIIFGALTMYALSFLKINTGNTEEVSFTLEQKKKTTNSTRNYLFII